MSVEIVKDYVPGCIGRIAELHGLYYHRHAGFGVYFESKVATELSEFLGRYDGDRDGIWLAMADGRVEGAIAIQGADASLASEAGAVAVANAARGAADERTAHLRWFIVSDALRGQGAGNTLISAATAFCRARRYPQVDLWTFEGLDSARHLYEKHGFRLAEQRPGRRWGAEVNEQRFELGPPG